MKAIDDTVIQQLAELVDDDEPDFMTDLLQGYIDNITRHLSDLLQLVGQGDTVTIAKTAHSLTGASGNIGALQMAALFKKLVHAARIEDKDTMVELISELRAEFQLVMIELEPLIDLPQDARAGSSSQPVSDIPSKPH